MLFRIVERHFACVASLFQHFLVAEQHVHGFLRLLVAASLRLFLQFGETIVYRFEVLDL